MLCAVPRARATLTHAAAPCAVGMLRRDLLDTSRNQVLWPHGRSVGLSRPSREPIDLMGTPAPDRSTSPGVAATPVDPARTHRSDPGTVAKLGCPRRVVSCRSVPPRRVESLSILEFALLVLACSPQPRPCVSPTDCPQAAECLANSCAPIGADPVNAISLRVVLRPIEAAVVAEAGDENTLASAVVFGSRSVGASALYLRFRPPPIGPGNLERAFLVLEPMPGAQPTTADVSLAVWRIAGSWTATDLTWMNQPPATHPGTVAIARTGPPQMLRVDVTELVRHFRSHPRENRGVVLKADGGTAFGAAYCTGLGVGTPPALELYYRRQAVR